MIILITIYILNTEQKKSVKKKMTDFFVVCKKKILYLYCFFNSENLNLNSKFDKKYG